MSSAVLRLARPLDAARRLLLVVILVAVTAALALTASSARADGIPLTASNVDATTQQGQAVLIRFVVTADPADGALFFFVNSPGLVSPSHGTVVRNLDGLGDAPNATYTPAPGFVGQDTFTYRVSNSKADSAPATVTVTVTPAPSTNRAPTAAAQSVSVQAGFAVRIELAGVDPDGDPLTFAKASDPVHGTLAAQTETNAIYYDAAADYVGSDSFTFTASDGALSSAPATVSITVTPVRPVSPPTSTPPTLTTPQDTPIAFRLTGSNADGDEVYIQIYHDTQHGEVSGEFNDYVYTPAPGYSGPDVLHYEVSVRGATSPTYTVNITVTPKPGSTPISSPSVDTYRVTDQLSPVGKLVSPALTTAGGDRLLLAFVSADGPAVDSGQRVSSVTGGDLTWNLVRRSNRTWGTAEVWQAYASSTVSTLRVTAKLAKSGYSGEIAVVAYSGAAHSVGASAAAAATTGAPAVTLTPSTSGSLVWAVGHDWTRSSFPVPPSGQRIQTGGIDIRSGDSYWTQSATAPVSTTALTLGSIFPTTDRWQMVAVEVPAAH